MGCKLSKKREKYIFCHEKYKSFLFILQIKKLVINEHLIKMATCIWMDTTHNSDVIVQNNAPNNIERT